MKQREYFLGNRGDEGVGCTLFLLTENYNYVVGRSRLSALSISSFNRNYWVKEQEALIPQ